MSLVIGQEHIYSGIQEYDMEERRRCQGQTDHKDYKDRSEKTKLSVRLMENEMLEDMTKTYEDD